MLPAYFADGLAHALMGPAELRHPGAAGPLPASCGSGAVFFVALSQIRCYRAPASVSLVAGLLLTSSALFFLPAHLPWRGGSLDAAWQFLHYPLSDWDILLLGMPYHRSLLTHSVAPVLLVLPLASGRSFVAGIILGLASHLLALYVSGIIVSLDFSICWSYIVNMTRPTIKQLFPEPIEFDWDEGNAQKHWDRHHVSQGESESIFFNEPKFVCNDSTHTINELRYICLGKTKQGRYLFISFTLRNDKVRVISARDMTDREHQEFRKYEKENS